MDAEKIYALEFEKYNANTHRLGRIFEGTAIVLLLGAPFVIGAYLGSMPNLKAALTAFLAIGIDELL